LWAWGANGNNGVGDGTAQNKLFPVQIGQATNWVWASAGPARSV
jgi:hypothetical protein